MLYLCISFFQCINVIVSWIVIYKVYQYHAIRVFYISHSILYKALLYCYSLYMQIHNNSLNYMYDNCVHCILLYLVFCVLYSVLYVLFLSCDAYCCSLCLCVYLYSVCVHIVCILCAYCVHIVCCILCANCCIFCSLCLCIYMFAGVLLRMCVSCAYVCAYVCAWGVRLRCCATQSDTPHVGCLCGHRVRIIKAKKNSTLIKLKSIWFSTFLLCFKIMLLLSEKVSIK